MLSILQRCCAFVAAQWQIITIRCAFAQFELRGDFRMFSMFAALRNSDCPHVRFPRNTKLHGAVSMRMLSNALKRAMRKCWERDANGVVWRDRAALPHDAHNAGFPDNRAIAIAIKHRGG